MLDAPDLDAFSFDLELPFECDDEYWENDDPSKAFVQPPSKPSYVAYFIWSIKLGDILAHALRTIVSYFPWGVYYPFSDVSLNSIA